MKKMIFMIVALITLLVINMGSVYGAAEIDDVEKTFVCLVGGNYEEYLKFDGYKEVKREVNFNQVGEYFIVYQKNNSATQVTKKVVVLNSSQLLNQGYYENKIYPLTSPSTLISTITASLSLGDGRSVIAYNIGDPDNREAGSTIVIALVEGLKIKWQKVLREEAFGSITSLAWEGNKFVGVGTLYNDLTKNDGWLMVLDDQGRILVDQTYGGSGHDYFNFIQVTSDEYLIGGKSNSTDSIYIGSKKLTDSVIVIINKNNLQVKSIYNLGTDGNDELVGFIFDGMHYYAIQKTTTTKLKTQIIKVNLNGKVVSLSELNFPDNLEIIRMKSNDHNEMYFMAKYYSYQYEYDLISFYQLQTDLSLKELDVHKKNGDKKVIGLDFNFLENGEIALLYLIQESNKSFGYQLKFKKDNVTTSFIESMTGTYRPLYGLVTPVPATIMMNNQTGQLAIAQNNSVNAYYLGKDIIDDKLDSIYEYQVLINNQVVRHSEGSMLSYNPELFGSYLLKYYFDTPSLTLAYYLDLYVDLAVSVKDHQTYDLNTKLTFNGEAILNNQRITSNYVVKEPGTYILEITGKDNRKKFINFTIENLSVNQEPVSHYQVEMGKIELTSSEINEKFPINFQKDVSNDSAIDFRDEWFLGFPILSGLIIIYALVRRRWIV